MWLPATTTVEPASEPVTLAEAKAQCRIDGSDEDTLLQGYIKAARQHVEGMCGIRIISQTVAMSASTFDDLADLPVAPVQSVVTVKYLDEVGAEQTLSSDVYEVAGAGLSPSIRPRYSKNWPSARPVNDAVRVTAIAGYSTVPEPIRHAILLTVEAWQEARQMGDMPPGAYALLTNFRRF